MRQSMPANSSMPSWMMARTKPQGILGLVTIDNSVLNPPLGTCPDHALGVFVGGAASRNSTAWRRSCSSTCRIRRRLVRVQHGRKLLEVAKEDILPGGTATQRHVGGQQTMELVAMERATSRRFDCLKVARAAQPAKQRHGQARETGGAAEV